MGPAAADSGPRKRFRRDELDEEEKMDIVEDDDDYEECAAAFCVQSSFRGPFGAACTIPCLRFCILTTTD